MMLTGLFLGAGASYEVGMPLVGELTDEIKAWLTPDKLRVLNRGWRAQGGGHDEEVIDELAATLARTDMHYESILGSLETHFRRSTPLSQDFRGLYAWFVELVYHFLYLRHVNNVQKIKRNLSCLDGIVALAQQHKPLWVFSLNHDQIVECLAAERAIPVSAGFSGLRKTLPRRDSAGRQIGELTAEVISAAELERGLPFFRPGTHGINLLKIHGALDIFTFDNGRDLLRLLPQDCSTEGVIETLRIANEELRYVDASSGRQAKATNEIAYADEQEEMQFLRRTLLAGAFKFDARRGQVLPKQMLTHFRSNLNSVTRLICVGYGFGDAHINGVMREWLEFSPARTLEIVAPKLTVLPPSLLHLARQVTVVDAAASTYFDQVGGIARSEEERLERRLALEAAGIGAIGEAGVEIVEEVDAARVAQVDPLLARAQAERFEEMALACAVVAGDHEVVVAAHEVEARELEDEGLVERGLEVPVERLEGLALDEAAAIDPPDDALLELVGGLEAQDVVEQRGDAGALAGGPREEVIELAERAGQPEEVEVSSESSEDGVVGAGSALAGLGAGWVASLGHAGAPGRVTATRW
jgi:hypothetical protein